MTRSTAPRRSRVDAFFRDVREDIHAVRVGDPAARSKLSMSAASTARARWSRSAGSGGVRT